MYTIILVIVEKYVTVRGAVDCNTVWCKPIAFWTTKAADPHLDYVILITFPRQIWLCEHDSLFCL
jgi:hypothetical protein